MSPDSHACDEIDHNSPVRYISHHLTRRFLLWSSTATSTAIVHRTFPHFFAMVTDLVRFQQSRHFIGLFFSIQPSASLCLFWASFGSLSLNSKATSYRPYMSTPPHPSSPLHYQHPAAISVGVKNVFFSPFRSSIKDQTDNDCQSNWTKFN